MDNDIRRESYANLPPDGPPYHVVNSLTGKHIGPFSTEFDASLAKLIGTEGWFTGKVMGDKRFKEHLDGK